MCKEDARPARHGHGRKGRKKLTGCQRDDRALAHNEELVRKALLECLNARKVKYSPGTHKVSETLQLYSLFFGFAAFCIFAHWFTKKYRDQYKAGAPLRLSKRTKRLISGFGLAFIIMLAVALSVAPNPFACGLQSNRITYLFGTMGAVIVVILDILYFRSLLDTVGYKPIGPVLLALPFLIVFLLQNIAHCLR